MLGGAILGDKQYIDEPVQKLMRHTGPALSPFNAWTLLKGLETLAVRVEYQNASAHRVAEFLENHPAVSWVRYPFLESHPQYDLAKRQMTGGGTVVTFELKGGSKERAFEVLDKLRIDRHLQQPRRLQVVDHASGHHHAPGHGSGGSRRDRSRRRSGADLGGAGGNRGSHRRSRPGVGLGVLVSRKSQAKQARRKKRRAVQNSRWLPDTVLGGLSGDIELAAVLERLDERITERGWVFDEELSDDESVLWYLHAVDGRGPDDGEVVPVTTIAMTSDDAEVVHVVFVGTADDYQFGLEELFSNLEVIEGYRMGSRIPGVRLDFVGALDDALRGLRALLVGLPRGGVEVEEYPVQPELAVEPTSAAGAEHLGGLRGEPQRRRHRHMGLRLVQCLDDRGWRCPRARRA